MTTQPLNFADLRRHKFTVPHPFAFFLANGWEPTDLARWGGAR